MRPCDINWNPKPVYVIDLIKQAAAQMERSEIKWLKQELAKRTGEQKDGQ